MAFAIFGMVLFGVAFLGTSSLKSPVFSRGTVKPFQLPVKNRARSVRIQAENSGELPGEVKQVFEKLFPAGEGKQIVYGVLTRDLQNVPPSPEEQKRRRDKAAAELVNINDEERARRRMAGQIGYVFTIGLAATLIWLPVPPLARLGLFFPVAFSQSFIDSANKGL
eukprot:CAMPEP_0167757988 /NCGR_PEP_ID=MMETSP0110_2-20121227/10224_1 /TAXON_ID=629695 /ORGANISM="Gymnochlora sp., Strain CCMP2014" /LENGTH=165 /DNA_ID=CAMNT_0007644225 /DNA_START=100 /DNA_END=597 /DNA_ORIENTATION=-